MTTETKLTSAETQRSKKATYLSINDITSLQYNSKALQTLLGINIQPTVFDSKKEAIELLSQAKRKVGVLCAFSEDCIKKLANQTAENNVPTSFGVEHISTVRHEGSALALEITALMPHVDKKYQALLIECANACSQLNKVYVNLNNKIQMTQRIKKMTAELNTIRTLKVATTPLKSTTQNSIEQSLKLQQQAVQAVYNDSDTTKRTLDFGKEEKQDNPNPLSTEKEEALPFLSTEEGSENKSPAKSSFFKSFNIKSFNQQIFDEPSIFFASIAAGGYYGMKYGAIAGTALGGPTGTLIGTIAGGILGFIVAAFFSKLITDTLNKIATKLESWCCCFKYLGHHVRNNKLTLLSCVGISAYLGAAYLPALIGGLFLIPVAGQIAAITLGLFVGIILSGPAIFPANRLLVLFNWIGDNLKTCFNRCIPPSEKSYYERTKTYFNEHSTIGFFAAVLGGLTGAYYGAAGCAMLGGSIGSLLGSALCPVIGTILGLIVGFIVGYLGTGYFAKQTEDALKAPAQQDNRLDKSDNELNGPLPVDKPSAKPEPDVLYTILKQLKKLEEQNDGLKRDVSALKQRAELGNVLTAEQRKSGVSKHHATHFTQQGTHSAPVAANDETESSPNLSRSGSGAS